jgi:hypothetical protein
VLRDGKRVSTLDLIAPASLTLLTSRDDGGWRRAAEALRDAPLEVVSIGRDAADPDGRWAALAGIAGDGALLVRPDQHVAWRAHTLPKDPARVLGDVLARVLGRPPQTGA